MRQTHIMIMMMVMMMMMIMIKCCCLCHTASTSSLTQYDRILPCTNGMEDVVTKSVTS